MKKGVLLVIVLAVLLVGCASQKAPEIICKSPYMRHADGCCLDKNANSVCDIDEDDEPFFVEADYGDSPFEEVPDAVTSYAEPVYADPVEEDEDPVLEEFVPPEPIKKTYTTYDSPTPEMTGWAASDDFMFIEVDRMVLDVNPIKQVDRLSPDKEVILKEIYFTIKNFDYNYLNPVLYFQVGDWNDPFIIKEILMCDRSDDMLMEGCLNALPIAEEMQVKLHVNTKIPRIDDKKDVTFRFSNKRIESDDHTLIIKKTVDIQKIPGAEYI